MPSGQYQRASRRRTVVKISVKRTTDERVRAHAIATDTTMSSVYEDAVCQVLAHAERVARRQQSAKDGEP